MKYLFLTSLIWATFSIAVFATTTNFTYVYKGNKIMYTTLNDSQVGTIQSDLTEVKGELVIPATVQYGTKTYKVVEIGYKSFKGNSDITSVTIPTSIYKINQDAFNGCSNLKTLYFNAEYCSFCGTYGDAFGSQLEEIIIGDDVKTIPSHAFYSSYLIKTVNLPKSVESIGSYAFFNCRLLENVTGGENVRTIGESAFSNCASLTEAVIGNSITKIGTSAFQGCNKISSITIPESVNYMGPQAFYECNGLEVVKYNAIDMSVGGNYSSVYFSKIQNLIIGENVNTIPDYLFRNCSIQSLRIAQSVRSIGIGAFGYAGIGNLTIVNPNSWAIIEFGGTNSYSTAANPLCTTNTFSINGGEVSHLDLNIEDSTVSDFAFYTANNLKTIRIKGKGVGYFSFGKCSNVTDVCLDVESLEGSSFGGCSSLRNIYCLNIEPPKVSTNPFSDCTDLTLFVPMGTRSKYEADEYWSQFSDIKETNLEDIDSIFRPDYDLSGISLDYSDKSNNVIDFNLPYQIYTLSGSTVYSPIDKLVSGIYIVRQGNKVMKIGL